MLESLTSNVGEIKVVVATSSLGCGVNKKGVQFIVHFGPAFHTVDYCQQIGRAGRDTDQLCHAVLYSFPTGNTNISRSMKKYISQSRETCLRTMLFTPFNENNDTVHSKLPHHECCSFCAKSCDYSTECSPTYLFFCNTGENDEQQKETPVRSVTDAEKSLVKEMILHFHEQQCSHIPLLAPGEILTGVTGQLMTDVLEKLPFIDSVSYIVTNLNVGNLKLANEIATIIKEVFIDDECGRNV